MPSAAQAHWDQVIADLEARLKKARILRDALDDPELANELARSLGLEDRAARTTQSDGGGHKNRSSYFDTLLAFFAGRNNEWATINEIAEGCHLNGNSVRQLVYKTASDRIERSQAPGGGRTSRFRIMPDVMGEQDTRENTNGSHSLAVRAVED